MPRFGDAASLVCHHFNQKHKRKTSLSIMFSFWSKYIYSVHDAEELDGIILERLQTLKTSEYVSPN